MLYVVCGRGTNHINTVYSCDFLAREIGWDHRKRSNFLAREVSSFIEEHSSNMKMCSCLISTQIITSISANPWSSLLECWDECQGLWQKQCEYDQQTKASRLNPEHVACKVIPLIEGMHLPRRSTSFSFYGNLCNFNLTSKKAEESLSSSFKDWNLFRLAVVELPLQQYWHDIKLYVLCFQQRISQEYFRILNSIPNLAEQNIVLTSLGKTVFLRNLIPSFQPWTQPHRYFKHLPWHHRYIFSYGY